MHKIKVFYYFEGGVGLRSSSLYKSRGILVTVRAVLKECTSGSMEHLYLVPEGIILFRNIVTCMLDGNIYIYIYILRY
jgi:hypothetical protein